VVDEVQRLPSLLNEVQDLINRGYKEAPPMRGIVYQTVVEFLDGVISQDEMLQKVKFDLHGYIRRQLTWFKRDKEIRWFDLTEPSFDKKIETLVESFLRDE
jgi:tRNA dimethylallyltransferase